MASPVTAISFSSCGWLMLYNYGVAKALGESDVIDISASELLGASGGALTAIGLVLGLNFDEIAELALQCVGRCHGSVSGAFDLRAYLTEVLDHQFKAFGEQQPSSKHGAGKSVKTKRSTLAAKVLEDNEEEEVSSVASPVLSDASDESRYFSADDDAPNLVDGGAGDGCDGNTDMDKGDDDKDDDKDDDEEEEGEGEASARRSKCVAEVLAGRVSVSVTTLPWLRNKRYRTFEDPEHVKQVLIASCCATPIAGFPFKLDGEWVIDGGFADFQPLSAHLPRAGTITVSPFYCTHADIRPSRYVPLWWSVYPPRPEDFRWVFALGYDDARSWLSNLKTRVDASKAKKEKAATLKKAKKSGTENNKNHAKNKPQDEAEGPATPTKKSAPPPQQQQGSAAQEKKSSEADTQHQQQEQQQLLRKSGVCRANSSGEAVVGEAAVVRSTADPQDALLSLELSSLSGGGSGGVVDGQTVVSPGGSVGGESGSGSLTTNGSTTSVGRKEGGGGGSGNYGLESSAGSSVDPCRFPSDASRSKWESPMLARLFTSVAGGGGGGGGGGGISRRYRIPSAENLLSLLRSGHNDGEGGEGSSGVGAGAGAEFPRNGGEGEECLANTVDGEYFGKLRGSDDGGDDDEDGYCEEEEENDDRRRHSTPRSSSRLRSVGSGYGGWWSSADTSECTSAATSVSVTPTTPLHACHPTMSYMASWPYAKTPSFSWSAAAKAAAARVVGNGGKEEGASAGAGGGVDGAEHENGDGVEQSLSSSSSLATPYSFWGTKHHHTPPPAPPGQPGPHRHLHCSEPYSFRRVFGYNTVLSVVPCYLLDAALVLVVFVVAQPLAFGLVYLELLSSALCLALGCAASKLSAVARECASNAKTAVQRCAAKAKAAVRAVPRRTGRAAQRLVVLVGGKVAGRLGLTGALAMLGGGNGHDGGSDEVRAANRQAAFDQAAGEAVAASLARAVKRRERKERRVKLRELRKTCEALLDPTLLLRMVPVLGKPLTGKAYRLRRKLCELSIVFRICVHFL